MWSRNNYRWISLFFNITNDKIKSNWYSIEIKLWKNDLHSIDYKSFSHRWLNFTYYSSVLPRRTSRIIDLSQLPAMKSVCERGTSTWFKRKRKKKRKKRRKEQGKCDGNVRRRIGVGTDDSLGREVISTSRHYHLSVCSTVTSANATNWSLGSVLGLPSGHNSNIISRATCSR